MERKRFIDYCFENINVRRADSGLNRLLVVAGFIFITFVIFILGYKLILLGANGEFKIFSEFRGMKLALWSLSPGIFFCCGGIIILVWGLPKTLKAFFDWKK